MNKVILVGNLGKDPEVKYLTATKVVASFSLATTERGFVMADGTQVPERTDWHSIVVWGGYARFAESYLRKGSRVYVEGKLRTRSWDDANGVRHYGTEIVADVIENLSPRGDFNVSQAQAQTVQNAMPNVGANTQNGGSPF